MERRTLGGTGISVSSTCLGTMMFGMMGNTDHDESVRMIHTALDAGVNFVDTADVYSMGESEQILGRALKGRRDDVVLATKFGLPISPDPNRMGGSRRWIEQAVEDSLRRLRGRPHRPLPAAPLRPHDRPRGDAGGAHRPGAGGQDPGLRLLDLRRPSASSRPTGPRSGSGCCGSAPSSPATRSSPARSRRAVLPRGAALRHGRAQLRPAQRRLAVGPGRAGGRAPVGAGPAGVRPLDPRQPGQARGHAGR